MARRKLPKAPVLLNWEDVDRAMQKVIAFDNQLTVMQTQLDAALETTRAEWAAKAKPLQDEVKVLGSHIKQFVTANREDMGDKKTMELTHGKTGFRVSTKCVVSKGTEQAVVARLEELCMLDCVMVKKTVNKEKLKTNPADVIAAAGARLETNDTFWYEVYHDDLQAADG